MVALKRDEDDIFGRSTAETNGFSLLSAVCCLLSRACRLCYTPCSAYGGVWWILVYGGADICRGWHLLLKRDNKQFLSPVCSLLSGVCSLRSALCSPQSALCPLPPAVCCLLSAVCRLSLAVCSLLSAICCLQFCVLSVSLVASLPPPCFLSAFLRFL
jgi:hypothetical protein